jgi:Family of unknown function (DUF5681)
MPDRKNSGTSDYVVGHRRPPKATQFAAGKSGNPKGRPKGSRSVGAVLKDILQQKIAVTENGKTRRIPALEVMLRRLANDAMRSDPNARRLLLSLIDRYSDSPDAKNVTGTVVRELYGWLKRSRYILASLFVHIRTRRVGA